MDWYIETRLADYTLRIANAYKMGQFQKAKKLKKELDAFKRKYNL